MTENKKFALRAVIEQGLKVIAICCNSYEFVIYKPSSWRKHYQLVKAAGLFSEWLRKLAFYSSINFEGFNEDAFWQEYELLGNKLPNNAFIMTKQFYEQQLDRIEDNRMKSDK